MHPSDTSLSVSHLSNVSTERPRFSIAVRQPLYNRIPPKYEMLWRKLSYSAPQISETQPSQYRTAGIICRENLRGWSMELNDSHLRRQVYPGKEKMRLLSYRIMVCRRLDASYPVVPRCSQPPRLLAGRRRCCAKQARRSDATSCMSSSEQHGSTGERSLLDMLDILRSISGFAIIVVGALLL
ncbi:hypothetical protein KCU91_g99, partial [Aureobasidium melanogenum]